MDHDRTRFPLVARHLDVTCAECHVDRQWTGIGLTCRACHGPIDPHAGQFAADCAECHVASGWEDLTFSHASTGFALADAHAEPACAACHPGGRYVGTPTTCIGCHAADDRHDGGFGTSCGACHRATTWVDWTFDHDLSSFPLTGAHRGASCQGCHDNGRFEGTPTACASCHANPASHTSAFGTLCSACHSTAAWRPASFNAPHPFPMNHGNAGATCTTCHPASFATNSCTGCHVHSPTLMNEHHKEVPGYTLGDCLRCHPGGSKED